MKTALLRAVAGLLLAGTAGATISVTPGSVTYTQHSGATVPTARELLPQKNRVLTLVSSGAWTVAQLGIIATTCRFGGACFSLTGEFDGTAVTSGAAGTFTLALNWNTGVANWVNPGVYTGTIRFTEGGNTADVAVSLTLTDNTVSVAVTDQLRTSATTAAGCSAQVSQYPSAPNQGFGTTGYFTYPNICPITDEAPMVLPSLRQPAIGATYVDPQFGGTVQRIAGPGVIYDSGGLSPFTSNDTYVVANTGVYKTADSTLFRAQSRYGWNIASTYPSPIDDNVLYGTTGSLLQKYNIATDTLTTVADFNVSPVWIHTLYEGGTIGMSEDGWQAFYDNGTTQSVTLLTTSTGSKTFVVNSGSYPLGTNLTVTCAGGGCGGGGSMSGLVTAAAGTSITVNFTAATGSVTGSNWTVARTMPFICAVNVYQIDTVDHAVNNNNTYCATWSPSQSPGFTVVPGIDWVQTLEVDQPTGKRYVWMSGSALENNGYYGSTVFSVGTAGSGSLTQEYVLPEAPSRDINNDNGIMETGETGMSAQAYTHLAGCIDRDGQAWMFGTVQDTHKADSLTFARISAGKQIMLPVEAGGGLKIIGPSNWDVQPGCSTRAHLWSYAPLPTIYGTIIHRYVAKITAASYSASGNVVTITLAAGHYVNGVWTFDSAAFPVPWAGTNPVLIANITGSWAPLNGIFTSTYISGTTVSVVCPACSGSSGALNTEALLGDGLASPLNTTLGDRVTSYVYKPGRQVHQIAMTRATDWIDTQGAPAYYSQSTVGSISRSGRYVAFNSNFGSLDYLGPSPYIALTGLDYLAITNVSAQPGETSAIFLYTTSLPTASCTLDLAKDSAFQTSVTHPTDAGGTVARRIALTGLTASTNYWVRTQCGLDVESASFTTLATGSVVTKTVASQLGNPVIATMTKVVPEHRKAGSSTWVADSAVSCAAGCTAAWTGDAGFINEYHFLWQNAGSSTLQTSQTFSTMVGR